MKKIIIYFANTLFTILVYHSVLEIFQNNKRGRVVPKSKGGINREGRNFATICRYPFLDWNYEAIQNAPISIKSKELIIEAMKKTGSRYVPKFSCHGKVRFDNVALYGFKTVVPSDVESYYKMLHEEYSVLPSVKEKLKDIIRKTNYEIVHRELSKVFDLEIKFVRNHLIGECLDMIIHEKENGEMILVPKNIHNAPQYVHIGFAEMMAKKLLDKEVVNLNE